MLVCFSQRIVTGLIALMELLLLPKGTSYIVSPFVCAYVFYFYFARACL
jgi:hypothetical protein